MDLKDYKEAVRWFTMAVKQDSAPAKCNLAELYAKGLGVEKDVNEAKRLAREGFDQGAEYCEEVSEKYDLGK